METKIPPIIRVKYKQYNSDFERLVEYFDSIGKDDVAEFLFRIGKDNLDRLIGEEVAQEQKEKLVQSDSFNVYLSFRVSIPQKIFIMGQCDKHSTDVSTYLRSLVTKAMEEEGKT